MHLRKYNKRTSVHIRQSLKNVESESEKPLLINGSDQATSILNSRIENDRTGAFPEEEFKEEPNMPSKKGSPLTMSRLPQTDYMATKTKSNLFRM